VNSRATWINGKSISYSTDDEHVALIGDSIHAMTPSMREGYNCGLEIAVKLVENVGLIMKVKGVLECSIKSLSEGIKAFGAACPAEIIPIQEISAQHNIFKKESIGQKPLKNTKMRYLLQI
jgi:hypothetical protein